jgi:hypothetical protein
MPASVTPGNNTTTTTTPSPTPSPEVPGGIVSSHLPIDSENFVAQQIFLLYPLEVVGSILTTFLISFFFIFILNGLVIALGSAINLKGLCKLGIQ